MFGRIFGSSQPKFVPWSILNTEASNVIEPIKQEWLSLLANENLTKEDYKKTLIKHAHLFFHNITRTKKSNIVICDFKLNNSIVIDFVIAETEYSLGITYNLVKIITPHTSAYNWYGSLTDPLVNATSQLESWKSWIKNNESSTNAMFPSKRINGKGEPIFRYYIFSGMDRRSDFDPAAKKITSDLSVWIKSFKHITKSFVDREFDDNVSDGGATVYASNPQKAMNRLANPFFQALTHSDWINITRNSNFRDLHLMPYNADLLLKYLRDNGESEMIIKLIR